MVGLRAAKAANMKYHIYYCIINNHNLNNVILITDVSLLTPIILRMKTSMQVVVVVVVYHYYLSPTPKLFVHYL